MEELDARLIAARWRRAREAHVPRGFVERLYPRSNVFCRGAEQVSPVAFSRRDGSVLLRVHHGRVQTPMCSEEPIHHVGPERTPMPTFVAPRGARQNGGGSSSGGETWESSTVLETSLGGAQLLAHYAAQAREQGWAASEEAHAGPVSIQAFTLSDNALGNWWGVLTIVVASDTGSPRFASFRIGRETLTRSP